MLWIISYDKVESLKVLNQTTIHYSDIWTYNWSNTISHTEFRNIFARNLLRNTYYVIIFSVNYKQDEPVRDWMRFVDCPGIYQPDKNCKENHYVIEWFRSESLRNRTDFETGYHFMKSNTIFRLANSPLRLYQNNHG